MNNSRRLLFLLISMVITSTLAVAEPRTFFNRALLGGDGQSRATASAISPNGKLAVVALAGRGIYIWSVDKREHFVRYIGNIYVDALDVADDGTVLAVEDSRDIPDNRILLFALDERRHSRMVNIDESLRTRATIGLIPGRATAAKFMNHEFALITFGKLIQKWSLIAKEKIKSTETQESILDINFNDDKTQFITSSYDTNSSRKNNSISIFDDHLNLILKIPKNNHLMALARLGANNTVGILQGSKLTIEEFGDRARLLNTIEVPHALQFAFHTDGKSLWVATTRNKIKQIPFKDDSPVKTFAWPWKPDGSEKSTFSADGNNMLTWTATENARWWFLPDDLNAPNDANNFIVAQPNGSNRRHDITCRISEDRNNLILSTNTPIASSLFWRVYEAGNELVIGGEDFSWFDEDGTMKIAVQLTEESTSCKAFYETISNGP